MKHKLGCLSVILVGVLFYITILYIGRWVLYYN